MAGPPQPQKLCPSCGSSVQADANICFKCGYNFNTGPYSQPPSYGQAAPPYGQASPNWQPNYPRDPYSQQNTSADGFGIASLILGICAIPLVCVCYIGVPLGIIALILGGLGLKGRNRAMAIAGMICGGLALVFLVVLILVAVGMGLTQRSGTPLPFPR